MKEQLISLETAKLAKEKGFNEKCVSYYVLNYSTFKATGEVKNFSTPIEDNKNILQLQNLSIGRPHLALAPTQSLLQKWLREKHDIHFEIKPIFDVNEIRPYHISISKNLSGKNFKYKIIGTRETYEEALEIGLQEALKLILKII